MKNKLFYLIITVIVILSFWLIIGERVNNKSDRKSVDYSPFIKLKINKQTFLVKIAKTETEREQGLSNQKTLPGNEGLLFAFDKPGNYLFWMKDMNFPIDIIWLDENKKIVDITANLATSTYPNTVSSQKPALYVLEINAGLAEEYKIKIGDQSIF